MCWKGDIIEIEVDRQNLIGSVNFIGTANTLLNPQDAAKELMSREMHPDLHPHPRLPDDTRLWAILQEASGGTWAGCVYDVDRISEVIRTGLAHLEHHSVEEADH